MFVEILKQESKLLKRCRSKWLAVFLMLSIPTLAAAESIWSDAYKGPSWLTDYDTAVFEAKTTGQPILAFFSGSDWCPPCKKADKKIFAKQAFQDYAAENVVLLNIDFPRSVPLPESVSDKNDALLDKFGVKGFPTIVLIDPKTGKMVDRFGACGVFGLLCSEERIIKKIEAIKNETRTASL